MKFEIEKKLGKINDRTTMTFNDYQEACHETAVYPTSKSLEYLTVGFVGEAGELANKVKKVFRDHDGTLNAGLAHDLVMELGDAMWYIAELSRFLGYKLEDVADLNLSKLRRRAMEDKLRGDGDNR